MHISSLKQSRYLTRGDVGNGILVTIRELVQENVAGDGTPEELKWVVVFEEHEKPLVLNSVNAQLIASITHSEETDTWPGHKIVLYDDPTITFKGKVTGGIRVRAPRGQAAAKAAAAPARSKTADVPSPKPRPAPAPVDPGPEPDPNDDTPF